MNNIDMEHDNRRLDRREAIRIIGAAGAAVVAAACGSDTATSPSAVGSTATTGTGASGGTSSTNEACAVAPN
jgi:glucose/mannose transport system substrate-binding protein